MTRMTAAHVSASEATPPLLTIEQAAERFGTGERFVRRLISERRLSYVKLGRHVRIERSAVDAFIESGRVTSR